MRRWGGTGAVVAATLLLAAAVPGLAGEPQPTAGADRPGAGSAGQGTRVNLPGGPVFRQVLTLNVEAEPLSRVIAWMRREGGLPLSIGKGLAVEEARLSLRLRSVTVEAGLNAIAVALGERYRWERKGDTLELVRVERPRWADAASPEAAEALLLALRADRLVPAGGIPDPGAVSPEVKSLVGQDRAIEFAEALRAALPPGLMAQATSVDGLPVARLPAGMSERAFRMAVSALRGLALNGMTRPPRELARSPLLTGTEPQDLEVSRNKVDGFWYLWYTFEPPNRYGLGLNPRPGIHREWGPGQEPPGLIPMPK